MDMEFQSHSHLLEVPVANLQPGMFVAELDRPWLETPFALQGFFVHSREDIDYVAQHCAYVYVDPRRRARSVHVLHAKQDSPRRRKTYRDRSTLKNELATVKVDLTSANEALSRVFEGLQAGGQLHVSDIKTAIKPLIESVLRNGEALAALIRLRKRGEYLFNHSLSVAVWAAILGRQIGLPREELEQLAYGAAMLDVGMTRIDDTIFVSAKPLDDAGWQEVHRHVKIGVGILEKSGEVSPEMLAMVAAHHERYDGTGYPKGLSGSEIPLFARIAAIADSYDAMITPRPYAICRSSFEAIQELSDAKDQLYQGALVEQFMQAVGLFPTGAVVQLNTGEVGIVVKQNQSRRLRPKVALVLDGEGKRIPGMPVIDLAAYSVDGSKDTDRWITRELEPGAHGIHPEEFFL